MRKIDLSVYETLIRRMLKHNKVDTSIYDKIKGIIEEYLPCTECGEMLPLESFSRATAYKNRMQRFTICKECCKAINKPAVVTKEKLSGVVEDDSNVDIIAKIGGIEDVT